MKSSWRVLELVLLVSVVISVIQQGEAAKRKDFSSSFRKASFDGDSILKRDNSWDYIEYVTRWAGTEGYGRALPENVTSFTLHGLWPTRNDGSYPSFCNQSAPFDPSQISTLVDTLREVWYDYEQGDGFSFWSHEWDKHGTCASSYPLMDSQFNFFSQAIQVHQGLDLMGILANSQITPDPSNTYTQAQFIKAITAGIGFAPSEVDCEEVSGLGTSIEIIILCLTPDLKFQACPTSRKKDNSCNGAIYFPPIQH